MKLPHTLSASEVLLKLTTDPARGLSVEEREKRLQKHGLNELPEGKKPSLFSRFVDQIKNPIVLLLVATSIVSTLTQEYVDSVLILSIVAFMAGIGVFLERQSERSLDGLKALQTETTTILQDKKRITIPTNSLVPGDILVITEGDRVAADARVIESHEAHMDEAALTGESLPVGKTAHTLGQDTQLADQKNMIFSGTSVSAGSVTAVVTSTGLNTQLGKITSYLNKQDVRLTPMQMELEKLGKLLLFVTLFLVFTIFVLYTLRGEPIIESLLTTVSLAIAIVPEGLSAVMTVTLALAVKDMVKKKVVVKKLLAAEGLGSITHIATDKTGTVTEGRMHVVKVFLGNKLYDATDKQLLHNDHFKRLLDVLKFASNNKGPTEQALVAYLNKHGFSYELEGRMVEYLFNSTDKRMSVARAHNGQIRLFSKGAPDILIPRCTNIMADGPLTKEESDKALAVAEKLASDGFRVLALADRVHTQKPTQEKREEAESELTFIGLVALMDPLRSTVVETVTALKKAGITPLMITGDHPAIATYIAQQAGIINKEDKNAVLTGSQLDELFAAIDLPHTQKTLQAARVFARVKPEHKVMIVEMYQRLGLRIAMTGDGVNDAAAIKRADVGIAMSNGMDVTRDIADVVVTGAYDALIRAVAIGRTVKLRTQLYVHYLLSGNACEVGVFLLAIIAGLPNPLTPVMLLLINLLTDAAPAMAMAVEPEDPDVTKYKVKKQVESIISPQVIRGIAIQGIVGSVFVFLVFRNALPMGLPYAQTAAFTFFVFMESFRGFTARSFTKSVFSYKPFSNKLMNGAIPLTLLVWVLVVYGFPGLFNTTPLPISTVLTLLAISLTLPALEEGTKYVNRLLLAKRKQAAVEILHS